MARCLNICSLHPPFASLARPLFSPQKEHQLDINMISSGSSIVYSFFGNKAKLAERMKKPVSEVVKEVSKVPKVQNIYCTCGPTKFGLDLSWQKRQLSDF